MAARGGATRAEISAKYGATFENVKAAILSKASALLNYSFDCYSRDNSTASANSLASGTQRPYINDTGFAGFILVLLMLKLSKSSE
jgi:hypothetical protein